LSHGADLILKDFFRILAERPKWEAGREAGNRLQISCRFCRLCCRWSTGWQRRLYVLSTNM